MYQSAKKMHNRTKKKLSSITDVEEEILVKPENMIKNWSLLFLKIVVVDMECHERVGGSGRGGRRCYNKNMNGEAERARGWQNTKSTDLGKSGGTMESSLRFRKL